MKCIQHPGISFHSCAQVERETTCFVQLQAIRFAAAAFHETHVQATVKPALRSLQCIQKPC